MSVATSVSASPVRAWAYVALVVSSLLWGSMYPVAKPVLASVSPLHLAMVRAVVACLLLTSLVVARGDGPALFRVARRYFPETVALGITSFFLSSILAMTALELLPASVLGLLNNLSPLWLAVGTAAIVRPDNSRRLIVGAAIAFVGVALVLLRDATPSEVFAFGALSPLGVGIALTGSLVIATSTVVGRRLMVKTDPLVSASVASFYAAAIFLGLVGFGPGFGQVLSAPLEIKGLLLYVGVGCTALNFALWFYALREVPAARAAPFQYITPPFGVLLAALLLDEPLTLPLLAGTVLVIGGIVFAQQTHATGKKH